jgi:Domain of unknown function (DUF6985)
MTPKRQQTLTMPPFPPLHWGQFFWEGTVQLKPWAGFQTRQGAYGSTSSEDASDGMVALSVYPPDGEPNRPPSPEQANAFQHLLDHETAVRDAVLQAIFAQYPRLLEIYGEFEDSMEPIERPEELRQSIGLSTLHVLSAAKAGLTCIGFEFGCDWDEEHGLGVLTHNGRVLEIGQADTAFG